MLLGRRLREWAEGSEYKVTDTPPCRKITVYYEGSPLFRVDASSGENFVKGRVVSALTWLAICYCQTLRSLVQNGSAEIDLESLVASSWLTISLVLLIYFPISTYQKR
jgi:hypothetical protein